MSDKPSKFASVLRTRTAPEELSPVLEEQPPREANATEEHPAEITPVSDVRSVGRPRTGKRSNEEYVMTTIYIRAETRDEAENTLRKQRRRTKLRRDFSDLVEELVMNWVKQQSEQKES